MDDDEINSETVDINTFIKNITKIDQHISNFPYIIINKSSKNNYEEFF